MARFLRSIGGASATEYALILAIVTAGIVTAVTLLGGSIGNAIHNAATYINLPSSS